MGAGCGACPMLADQIAVRGAQGGSDCERDDERLVEAPDDRDQVGNQVERELEVPDERTKRELVVRRDEGQSGSASLTPCLGRVRGGRGSEQSLHRMSSGASLRISDCVVERRRAVALARHFREAEGLSIARSAERLGRSPATIKASSTSRRARRQVRSRRVTSGCAGAAALHAAGNGKGDAYAQGKRRCNASAKRSRRLCHPGAIQVRWTSERVPAAMREWRDRFGWLPSSCDWSRTHARRRAGEALERLVQGRMAGSKRRHGPLRNVGRRSRRCPDDAEVRTAQARGHEPRRGWIAGRGRQLRSDNAATWVPVRRQPGRSRRDRAYRGSPSVAAEFPQSATRLAAGETYCAQCCPRECGCAPSFETLLSYKVEPAGSASAGSDGAATAGRNATGVPRISEIRVRATGMRHAEW